MDPLKVSAVLNWPQPDSQKQGNSVLILMNVDRFSKMMHFMFLQKLPSAKETVPLLL